MDTVDPRMLEAGPSSPTTKLKLTIPSLKALRERADSIKSRDSPVLESAGVTKKTPRPPKLKPLREVLTVLIVKIKKKDDYAFFLKPVDTNAIPGYTDVIQRPMDFGTMTTKIERGRYRSLEEFASDFRLVISNAKTFNPPGTIYYTEAERIDAWASEQISRASAQVIEYETDWNIDVVHDEPPDGADDDDPDDDPGARDETATPSRHSPSNLPNGGGAAAGRRRGKPESAKPGLADALEPDGHLPGWKDGLSAFPPGSDLAETMVTLKLKGKRYKTKKERLRIERGDLPYAADGSLDYSELEDPFTVLSALVPDLPLSRPLLKPLYDPPPPTELYPVPPPVNQSIPDPLPLPKPPSSLPAGQRYRHWAVTRTGPTRRLKEKDVKEGDIEETPIDPRPPRPPTATDFGIYATLMSQLLEQPERLLSESALFDELIKRDVVGGDVEARAAQAWVLEVVYGGVEGLAYLRSLAEFLSSKESQRYSPALGMSLASYVESHVVDDITRSTHRTLHAIAAHLSPSKTPLPINLARAIALLPLRARIDLAALIRNPQELYEAENAVAGLSVTESLTRVGKLLGLLIDRQKLGETHDVMMTDGLVDAAKEIDAAKEVNAAKEDIFTGVRQEEEEGEDEENVEKSKDIKMEVDEDAAQRVIRLNLIALAKRVPIEQIAPMPAALLPAHVQGVVPTLEALKSDART